MTDTTLLRTSLAVAVPLWIHDVRDWPFERRAEQARKAASLVASKGDVLMYGGRAGEAAEVFNELACAVACCAYQPGGITLFGDHWEVEQCQT
jgi:hypothetical protein